MATICSPASTRSGWRFPQAPGSIWKRPRKVCIARNRLSRWATGHAWGPARVALHIALRTFLTGYEAPWIEDVRAQQEDVLLRADECVAAIGLNLGGPELGSAQRSARALVERAPFRESGYRLLMQVLAAQGNVAEALLVYEQLRRRLRAELGTNPGPAVQALQRRLLRNE